MTIWHDAKTNMMKSQLVGTVRSGGGISKDSINIKDIVTGITMTHPVHRARTPMPAKEDDIIVVYERKFITGEAYDYEYDEIRGEGNKQKMYLDVEGKVTLSEDVVEINNIFSGLTMLTEGKGGSIYDEESAVPPVYTTDRNTFTFKFDKDWKDTINSSTEFTSKQHYMHLRIYFAAHTKSGDILDCIVSIASIKPTQLKDNQHFKKISEFFLLWGCFGKDTLISMYKTKKYC